MRSQISVACVMSYRPSTASVCWTCQAMTCQPHPSPGCVLSSVWTPHYKYWWWRMWTGWWISGWTHSQPDQQQTPQGPQSVGQWGHNSGECGETDQQHSCGGAGCEGCRTSSVRTVCVEWPRLCVGTPPYRCWAGVGSVLHPVDPADQAVWVLPWHWPLKALYMPHGDDSDESRCPLADRLHIPHLVRHQAVWWPSSRHWAQMVLPAPWQTLVAPVWLGPVWLSSLCQGKWETWHTLQM